MTPLKAIRGKCLDCCCGQANEVKLCPSTDCPLYEYRFGKGAKKELSEEKRAELSERMKRLREDGKLK
jgi:hypothetical protein